MQVNISTRHGHLATETQKRIEDKLQKLTRFSDRISSLDVTVDLDKSDSPDVELLLHMDGTSNFVSKATGANGKLIGAVEAALQKLEEQVKRYKEKQIDQHRGSRPAFESPEPVESDEDDDETAE